MTAAHVLVVDDEPDIRELVKEILEDEGYEVTLAQDGDSAREALRTKRPDLILLDIWMPDIDGITLLKEWSDDSGRPCPVIMMSGHGTVETAVEATRLGAYDFLEKPLSMAKLLITVERALENDKLQRESAGAWKQTRLVVEPTGHSSIVQRLREQALRIAQHDTWVLISGEPGSGKEVLARWIHANSTRRGGPFVELGSGAIAGEDSARELFGSEEGDRVHYGYLEQAQGGTLFLNDVADLEPEAQNRLAGALETSSFKRVGGIEPVAINVRVMAATHRDLEREVAAGRFREDLFYHLNVVPLRVPPLRDHCEDVPELLTQCVHWFVDHEGLPYRRFSTAAQNRLRNHSYPGNIRELKNMVQRLLILGADEEIGLDEVEAALSSTQTGKGTGQLKSAPTELPLREAREEFERSYLRQLLKACEGSVALVAERAGMERTNLYRKLRALGIDPRNPDAEN
jgi:DNA-binding NtrC family response regulator